MSKNFGSGYEQSDLSGEIIDTNLTSDDLVSIAQDQIQANQTIIDQIRRGEDKIGQWLSDNHPQILDDEQPDFVDENWDEYAQWLVETEMPVE